MTSRLCAVAAICEKVRPLEFGAFILNVTNASVAFPGTFLIGQRHFSRRGKPKPEQKNAWREPLAYASAYSSNDFR